MALLVIPFKGIAAEEIASPLLQRVESAPLFFKKGQKMATIFQIKSLKNLAIADVASAKDFKVSEPQYVDSASAVGNETGCITPYCIDLPKREVVLIHCQQDIDVLLAYPFLYEAQRKYGKSLIRLSFDELNEIVNAGSRNGAVNPIFLYSTGRCGSTLLCNLMGDNTDIVSVSEPDYFTQLPFLLAQYGDEQRQVLVQVTHDLTLFLCAQLQKDHHASEIVIKFRSMCTEVAELIQCAFPRARNIFLYRNLTATVNSFASVLGSHPLLKLAKILNTRYLPLLNFIPVGILNFLPYFGRNIRAIAPLASKTDYLKVGIGLGTGVFTLAWLSCVDKVLKIHKNNKTFFAVILRYEDLNNKPIDVVDQVLTKLGLPGVDGQSEQKMAVTLSKDSQQGSEMSSSGSYVLAPADENLISRALAAHAEIKSNDFILPQAIQVVA